MILDRITWTLTQTQQEIALAARLGQFGHGVNTGDTTPQVRRDRFRAAIARVGESAVAGRGKDGKPVTFAQAFEAIYGEKYLSHNHHESGDGQ